MNGTIKSVLTPLHSAHFAVKSAHFALFFQLFLIVIFSLGLEKILLKFLHALTMSLLLLNFDQKYKFSNKNNMLSAWRHFKNIFPRPLFIIIFRIEMLKFHPYSILTRDTRVEFVIYRVLKDCIIGSAKKNPNLLCWVLK